MLIPIYAVSTAANGI